MTVQLPADFHTNMNTLYSLTLQEETLKHQLKQLTTRIQETKRTVLEDILKYGLHTRNFGIGTKVIHYKKEKKTDNLTQRFLRDCLARYFEADPKQAELLLEFILNSRNSCYVDTLEIDDRCN